MSAAISRRMLNPQRQFIFMFALTLLIQGLHMVEHVAQVLQKFLFHIVPAHGLIGQLDLEEVHFAFNLFYLTTLAIVMVGWLLYGSQICSKHKVLGAVLIGTVIVQSYHMVEHSVKLAQFLSTGTQGTPGIVGMHIDGVIFHALMNTAVFVPVVVVFFCADIQKQLFGKGPDHNPPALFQGV